MMAKNGSTFRAAVWDPVMILGQIVAMQTLYYAVLSLLVLIAALITRTTVSLDLIFNVNAMHRDQLMGWLIVFSQIISGAVGCVAPAHI